MDDQPKTPGHDSVIARALRIYYMLDENGLPVPIEDLLVWGRWMEEHSEERFLAKTLLEQLGLEVSTVFLGLDHDLTFRGEPVLWETMVFEDRRVTSPMPFGDGRSFTHRPSLDHQWRYRSRAAALAGHQAVVQALREGRSLDDLDLDG